MTPRLITLFALLIGLALFSYALTLPYYSDQQAAEDLIGNAYNLEPQDYYKKEAALRTDKIPFMDLGSGIAIASLTLLVYFIFTKVRTFKDLKNKRTLGKIATFVSANLVWLLLLPGTYWYYLFRGGRGDYPPFADSVGKAAGGLVNLRSCYHHQYQ